QMFIKTKTRPCSFKTTGRLCEEANRFIAFIEMNDEDYDGSTIYLFNPITNEWTNKYTPTTPSNYCSVV
ncbi:hypothetical protein PENTCL1PPCAC_4662, partial [Pristionchus entomophagus]